MTVELARPAETEERQARARSAWVAIPRMSIETFVRDALVEDLGHGDVTTAATVDPRLTGNAILLAKAPGVPSGIEVARMVFREIDSSIEWMPLIKDGAAVEPGEVISRCRGSLASILQAERVALNFLQHMSGIATTTAEFVSRISHTRARILDTRKTVPGLRVLDKYAVVCGGGFNHRFGLFDGVLIKDNLISHTRARILDTRKTVPGLRVLDKYAVVCGGGFNHRFGLFDGVLIKDNHI